MTEAAYPMGTDGMMHGPFVSEEVAMKYAISDEQIYWLTPAEAELFKEIQA